LEPREDHRVTPWLPTAFKEESMTSGPTDSGAPAGGGNARTWWIVGGVIAAIAIIVGIVALTGGDDTTTTTTEATTTTAAETTTTAGEETTTTAGETTTTEPTSGADVLVGLAYDIGGRGDLSFNDSAAAGLDRAVADFGIQAQELEPDEGGENRQENLQLLSEAGANLIFAIGFAFADGVTAVAPNFPDSSYGIVDSVVDLPNVGSLVFAEEQGSALVGCIAALTSQTGSIGFIGGVEIDLIKKFEAGFIFGAQECVPDIQVSSRYLTQFPDFSGFGDPAKGREAAAALYDGGADVVYHAAGGSGNGLFQEAAARKASDPTIWAIGVDSDQYLTVGEDLQGVILTSMIKRVDVSVYETIKTYLETGSVGGVQVFDLARDGVGYSTSGDFISAEVIATAEALKAAIVAGEVTVPTAP
jgi:basic membrane protein A and related proteins